MEDESYNSVTEVNLSSIYPSDPESPRPDNFLQVDNVLSMDTTNISDIEIRISDTKTLHLSNS